MRQPALVQDHLSDAALALWVDQAHDKAAYKRRLVVLLTKVHRLHAPTIASMLGVSIQSVRLWLKQYNTNGKKGLERQGRGGRRWALLSPAQEASLVNTLATKAAHHDVSTVKLARQVIQRQYGRSVSRSYIYALLRRHNYLHALEQHRQQLARSRLWETVATLPDNFARISRPWLRK